MIAHSTVRVLTALFVCVWGGILILVFTAGYFIGPRVPPSGVTWEEHQQTIEDGSDKRFSLVGIAVTGIYMATVLLPHRWVVRNTLRYRVVLVMLCLPFLLVFGSVAILLVPAFQMSFKDGIGYLFIIAALSLLFLPACITLKTSRDLYGTKRKHIQTAVSSPPISTQKPA